MLTQQLTVKSKSVPQIISEELFLAQVSLLKISFIRHVKIESKLSFCSPNS